MLYCKVKLLLAAVSISVLFTLLYYMKINNNEFSVEVTEKKFLETTQTQKYEKLYEVNNFHYILSPNGCGNDSNIEALIIVTSYFGNVETRSAMRRAFSQDDLKQINLKRVFLLGTAPLDKYTTQASIENENLRFGDLVQGSFVEAYKNLTYKHTMGIKWASENCRYANYIIKMDDDTVVNIERIPTLLKSLKLSKKSKYFIAGYVLRNMVPIREPANKWYVTKEEYELSYYPTFVSGWFYITTPKTAEQLYKLSQNTKYFWIDDTFITGILAQQLQIKHFDISKYFAVHSEYMECCLDDIRSKNLNCDVIIGPNGGNNNLFYEFNNAISICNLHLCKNRTKPLEDTCVAKKTFHLGKGQPLVKTYQLH
ncbi:beta-1,3-galactosyltransferase 5 [Diorhabda sublineata]|uniref:beta-1,3-galactosyltransferase 5 n=1 Tax=Diorhabda sublineata TaxID=1163346 RepID=UPI0024E0D013|nr:beta-1,3-galactosyltransferase 5 [Diorhabda sublineata]